ncbi:hypothetical protein [Nonomuraea sp. NPDC002799]
MLALSLGAAWLLLAPLSLWLLIRGTTGERVGAIMTLVLLEGGTIAMTAAIPVPVPHPPAVARPAAAPPSCDTRAPAPLSAEVGKARDALVLSWPAGPRECASADVVVHDKGDKLLVWVYEGPRAGKHRAVFTLHHREAVTLPVHVRGRTAVLRVPLGDKSGFIPIDGRTGRRIPDPTP